MVLLDKYLNFVQQIETSWQAAVLPFPEQHPPDSPNEARASVSQYL
jgi:hypothetical protein